MTPYELATARRRTYHLFGRLFLEGVTAGLLPRLEAIPELAQAAQPFDADEAAAEHYQLIAVDVFPYESIFIDPSGLLGGALTDQTAFLYAKSGYEVPSDNDHLGHELGFMAHLCSAEAVALANTEDNTLALWRSRQQTFLISHLLRWLPALTIAVERSGSRFYSRLANLTLELSVDHLAETSGATPMDVLPHPPQLATEESRLKDIAAWLTTPPYSGLFLSREVISALARRHKIPRGFGDRAQLLTNLLRTAGQYDAASAVVTDLAAICRQWAGCYDEQQIRLPKLSPWLQPWQEHVTQTAVSLNMVTSKLNNTPS